MFILIIHSLPIQAEGQSLNDWFTSHKFTVQQTDGSIVTGFMEVKYTYTIKIESNGNFYINDILQENRMECEFKDGITYGNIDYMERLFINNQGLLMVKGSHSFRRGIEKVLSYMSKNWPEDYKIIKDNIINISQGYFSVQIVTKGICILKEKWAKQPKDYLMSCILHEAIHQKDYNAGKPCNVNTLAEYEKHAYEVQRAFLVKIKAKKYMIDWLDGQYESKWWEKEI